MNRTHRHRWLGASLALVACLATTASAVVLWNEDFSSVADWTIIAEFNGDAGASLSTDGALATFGVASNDSWAAFGPISGVAPLIPFAYADQPRYYLNLDVDSVSGSTSYELNLDQFDASTNYLSTVLGVFPAAGSTTFAGTTSVWLNGLSYDPSAVYLLPKLTVYTGFGNQTVVLDNLAISYVPEPSTILLLVTGAALVGRRVYRRRAGRP